MISGDIHYKRGPTERRNFDNPLIETRPMTRKEKRDDKNRRHRRNERRREVVKILRRSPDLWKAIGEAADIAKQLRNWY